MDIARPSCEFYLWRWVLNIYNIVSGIGGVVSFFLHESRRVPEKQNVTLGSFARDSLFRPLF